MGGAAQALRLQAVLEDLGWKLQPRLHVDISVAKAARGEWSARSASTSGMCAPNWPSSGGGTMSIRYAWTGLADVLPKPKRLIDIRSLLDP